MAKIAGSVLTLAFEFGINTIAGCALLCWRGKFDLKKPIPLFREIRPRWIVNAYSIGLADTSNDCPLGNKGFSSNAFLPHLRS